MTTYTLHVGDYIGFYIHQPPPSLLYRVQRLLSTSKSNPRERHEQHQPQMEPTYFTCTLGQAAELKNQQSVQNVNEFVEAQAKTNPDRPAVGFYTAPSSVGGKDSHGKIDWTYGTYTFSQILAGSVNTAKQLLEDSGETLSGNRSTEALFGFPLKVSRLRRQYHPSSKRARHDAVTCGLLGVQVSESSRTCGPLYCPGSFDSQSLLHLIVRAS